MGVVAARPPTHPPPCSEWLQANPQAVWLVLDDMDLSVDPRVADHFVRTEQGGNVPGGPLGRDTRLAARRCVLGSQLAPARSQRKGSLTPTTQMGGGRPPHPALSFLLECSLSVEDCSWGLQDSDVEKAMALLQAQGVCVSLSLDPGV